MNLTFNSASFVLVYKYAILYKHTLYVGNEMPNFNYLKREAIKKGTKVMTETLEIYNKTFD